jgi:hypothetical protein
VNRLAQRTSDERRPGVTRNGGPDDLEEAWPAVCQWHQLDGVRGGGSSPAVRYRGSGFGGSQGSGEFVRSDQHVHEA